MKKPLLIGAAVMVVLIGLLIWLAGSVGPETAPSETKSIEVEIDV